MWHKVVKEKWPLQRLVQMLSQTKNKEKETWKQSPLSPPESMKDIGPEDRDQVVKWIAELRLQFHFNPETFFLATSILDRFISVVKAQPKYLKCIAISCFYLASKITEEEDVVPRTSDLVADSGCGFRVCDVLRMERIILEKLSLDLNSATSLDYLHIFQVLSIIHYTDLWKKTSIFNRMGLMTKNLIKASSHYELATYPSAALALALMSLELEFVAGDPTKWTCVTGRLQELSKVQTGDLMMCREALRFHLSIGHVREFEDPNHRVPSFLPHLLNASVGGVSKFAHNGASGAMKRKASTSSQEHLLELSKKPHPDTSSDVDEMEFVDAYDSDKTLTASEGEDEEDFPPDYDKKENLSFQTNSDLSMRPTYAEIVKYGANSHVPGEPQEMCVDNVPSSSDAFVSSITARCSVQASCAFLSPSSHTSQQRGIRT